MGMEAYKQRLLLTVERVARHPATRPLAEATAAGVASWVFATKGQEIVALFMALGAAQLLTDALTQSQRPGALSSRSKLPSVSRLAISE